MSKETYEQRLERETRAKLIEKRNAAQLEQIKRIYEQRHQRDVRYALDQMRGMRLAEVDNAEYDQ